LPGSVPVICEFNRVAEFFITLLIRHLDDPRPIRSVAFHSFSNDNIASGHIVTVGEAVQVILERIANRSFGSSNVKAAIIAWWHEIQSAGEQKVLAEGAARGDGNSFNQAKELLKRYPQSALEPIAAGVRNATDSFNRTGLISVLGELNHPGAIPVFRHEMESAPDLESRVASAWRLWAAGDTDAVTSMLAEWNTPDVATVSPEGASALIRFLIGLRQKRALEALSARLSLFQVEVREEIIQTLTGPRPDMDARAASMADSDAEINPAEEALLAALLLDTQEHRGESIGSREEDGGFVDPRLCDRAAYAMHTRWPERYPYGTYPSELEREQQRIRSYNIWATRSGHPTLTVPQPAAIPAPPASVLDQSLRAATFARTDEQRAAALTALESLGPGALPAVWGASGGAPTAVQSSLREIALRFADTVSRVVVLPQDASIAPEFRTQLTSLAGKPLTSGMLTELFSNFMQRTPAGVIGLDVTANRNQDGGGFTLTVKLVQGEAHPKPTEPEWNTFERVRVRGLGTYAIRGSSTKAELSSELKPAVDAALQSRPFDPVSITFVYSRRT
jgi:hypothetical protein